MANVCDWKFFFHLILLAILIETSLGIDCYQCSGSDNKSPFQCNEFLGDDIDLKPEPCDAVYGASYCVKHTGRYEASCLDCYQCSSSEIMDCADGLIHFGGIQPQNCNHVFEAQFCIKSTSLGGGIGTKRFCSSLDLGNYCNYVQQPGDILTYRTCIHTCTGDGCNSSTSIRQSITTLAVVLLCNFLFFRYLALR